MLGQAFVAAFIFVTAYLPTGYNTASGTVPHTGSDERPATAACPRDMAFGTQLHLSGKVEIDVICEDRYASYLSRRVDVFVRYYREAIALTGNYQYVITHISNS